MLGMREELLMVCLHALVFPKERLKKATVEEEALGPFSPKLPHLQVHETA